MAVYVDHGRIAFRGMLMCHMVADTLEELHEMADKIGLKRTWFQPYSSPHYDISQSKRSLAVAEGAIEIDMRQLARLLRKWREQKMGS